MKSLIEEMTSKAPMEAMWLQRGLITMYRRIGDLMPLPRPLWDSEE